MHLETSTIVRQTVEQVWNFFMVPNNLIKWDRSVAQVISTSSQPMGVGSTYYTLSPTGNGRKKPQKMSYRLEEVIVPEKFVVLLTDSAMFKTALWEFRFEAVAEGTKISCVVDFKLRPLYWIFSPILARKTKAMDEDLEYLRKALDKEFPGKK